MESRRVDCDKYYYKNQLFSKRSLWINIIFPLNKHFINLVCVTTRDVLLNIYNIFDILPDELSVLNLLYWPDDQSNNGYYIYYLRIWNVKQYPFANMIFFCNLIWIFLPFGYSLVMFISLFWQEIRDKGTKIRLMRKLSVQTIENVIRKI